VTRGETAHRCRARLKKAAILQGLAAFVRMGAARAVADGAEAHPAIHGAIHGAIPDASHHAADDAIRNAMHSATHSAMHDASHHPIGP
jgi:hypothetical protein